MIADSLPMGILEDIQGFRKNLLCGDIVVMLSDRVVEAAGCG